jgi:hypothetical protein
MYPDTADKRHGRRMKAEIVVGVKVDTETRIAYTVDLSRGGVRVCSPLLFLRLGEPVELIVRAGEERLLFPGRVAREDGYHHVDRIGRGATAFFIRITDARFSEFITDNYYI